MASQEATSWLAEATTTIVFWASFPLVTFSTFSSFYLCSLPILLAAIVFMADCNCMRRDFKLNSPFSSPIPDSPFSIPHSPDFYEPSSTSKLLQRVREH